MGKYSTRSIELLVVSSIFSLVVFVLSLNIKERGVPQEEWMLSAPPRIGILAQPDHKNQSSRLQYIAASYPKWLETGGARSIPIPYDSPPELLDDILSSLHGLFLPGGSSDLPPSVTYLLTKIQNLNAEGTYFPVWGTCLGFEFLVQHFGGKVGSGYAAENQTLPLENVLSRELYVNQGIRDIVARQPITMNSHHMGVDPVGFNESPAAKLWEVTSTNTDVRGRSFVSTIEPRYPVSFPFYGVQYHPEKNLFEYATWPGTNQPYQNINHSPSAVEFGLYLSRFFVDKVRKSQQKRMEESDKWFPDVFTYPTRQGLAFEQVYLIPPASKSGGPNGLLSTASPR